MSDQTEYLQGGLGCAACICFKMRFHMMLLK